MQVDLKIEPDPASVFPNDPKMVTRIGVAAVNRTLTTGRAQFVRRIREEINLPAATVRDQIKITKANFDDPSGRIRMSKKLIPLIEFNNIEVFDAGVSAKVTKAGVSSKWTGVEGSAVGISVLVSKSKGREFLEGVFFARMKSGHVGLYERKRNQYPGITPRRELRERGGRRWMTELPIFERFGKTLVGYLKNAPGVLDEVVAGLRVTFIKNVRSQIDRFVAKKGATLSDEQRGALDSTTGTVDTNA